MKDIYLISGLGADERIFSRIVLPGYLVHSVKWIEPASGERIEDYAFRMSAQITAINPILVGVSFGGMVAVEIAKHIDIKQIILLSSAKNKREIPFYYRAIGSLKINKWFPVALLKKPTGLSNWFFGTTNAAEKKLLANILQDTDSRFLHWAIDKILNWKNKKVPENLVHIHGTADRILPVRFIKLPIKVFGGGHFMTMGKAGQISSILLRELL